MATAENTIISIKKGVFDSQTLNEYNFNLEVCAAWKLLSALNKYLHSVYLLKTPHTGFYNSLHRAFLILQQYLNQGITTNNR